VTFIIAVHVGEGIVLASDSRTTYNQSRTLPNNEIICYNGVHTTNSTTKTFVCTNKCGISTCGDGSISDKPVTSYIQSFIREKIKEKTKVDEIPNLLIKYFRNFVPIPNIIFLVAGYKEVNGIFKQCLYRVVVTTGSVEETDTSLQGSRWEGETITMSRLWVPMSFKNNDESYTDLENPEILWAYFTLQDAIDFAKYAVETTITTMRFQNVVETVGKPIDILVIQPEKDPFWISKKKLSIDLS